ncbi:MAG: M24 family metallopeptidase [Saprospiraceae bacterium]|nr:M24 family metallopeptidase [Saprospiraceae bacterium]
MQRRLLLLFICLLPMLLKAQIKDGDILPMRDRAEWINNMLEYRLDSLLPDLMDRANIDMWILVSREYNEDPVMKTMLPSEWLSARRRTIMVFYKPKNGDPFEKIAIARYSVGRLLKGEWNIDVFPDQWEALVNYIKEKNPEKIGLNVSDDFGLADGLVSTEHQSFVWKLPTEYHNRLVSAEDLSIGWLETRSKIELEMYDSICKIGHDILQEAFSEDVITPGETSTDDVVWWLRQRVRDLGLITWFHPTVSLQRGNVEKFDHLRSFSKRPEKQVIQYGDLLHVDFGITYLRLNTDQQQHFYVLKPDEKEAPKYLKDAFKVSNRVQDILTESFQPGKTGNQILADALKQAESEGIVASIYTHPIGFHGHAAGPTIGMWDNQKGTPGRGDYPLYYNTAFSIELNSSSEIKEWGKIIRVMLEEDGVFTEDGFRYLDRRQEKLETIPRSNK